MMNNDVKNENENVNVELKSSLESSSNDLGVYIILNRITQERSLFYAPNEIQARRIFDNAANSQANNPAPDFELHQVGEWNNKTGLLKAFKSVNVICMGVFKKELQGELKVLVSKVAEDAIKRVIKAKGLDDNE